MSEDLLRPTPWETRNLGAESFAVSDGFVAAPDAGVLTAALKAAEEEYGRIFVFGRIPKQEMHAVPPMQRAGFYYVETALVPYTVLKKNEPLNDFLRNPAEFVPGRYRLEELDVVPGDKSDSAMMAGIKAIAAESFSDDRFHLDPQCPKEIADRRFSFWVDDLIAKTDVLFYVMMLQEHPIGFMARENGELLLAGFAQQFVASGLGDFLWLSVLSDMYAKGFNQISTVISANNTSVLNLYVRLGFKFRNPAASFHYWSDLR